jgi:hypothetical protein
MNRFERRKQASIMRKIKSSIIDLTNYKVEKLSSDGAALQTCYAKKLNNCDGGISKEHYISHSILRQFGPISTKGIPWLSHMGTDITAESMVTKCLCRRHNNALGPIDDMAGKVFSAFKEYGTNKPEIVLIPGLLFERWALKLLLGMLGTKKIHYNDQKVSPDDLDDLWVNVLYGISPMPEGCGLYILYKPGDKMSFSNQMATEFLYMEQEIAGLKINFAGFQFWFSMVPKEIAFKSNHPNYEWIMYRPKSFNKLPYPQELRFIWD